MSTQTTDILISGGGTPGLALALLLGRAGLAVTVLEPYPAPPLKGLAPEGRTSALMQGSLNILKATGGWEIVRPYAAPLETLRIIDDSAGLDAKPVQTDFTAAEIGLDAFGMNVPNNILRAALAAETRRVKTIRVIAAGLEEITLSDGHISATLDNGDTITAALLAGADGRASPTREAAGITVKTRDHGQRAITCLIEHDEPHDRISTEFHRPSGPFTLVPLPGRMSSVVWVEYADDAETFMGLSAHAFQRALQDRTRGALGTVQVTTPPQSWPLKSLVASTLTAPRIALIAEAAHVLHPIGAQGLNLSLRDVAALAEIIVDQARLGLDPGSGSALKQYEARRRADIGSRASGTNSLNRLVSNDLSLLRHLRHAGLRMLDNVTPFKTLAMREGLAPADRDSRLAQGQAL